MVETANFSLGQLDFDARSGELSTRAQTRRLEPKAAGVLQMLCENEGAVVARQELLDRCWGEGEGSDEALTQAIAQIRRALEELGEPGLVETLAKRGYRIKTSAAQADRVERAPAARTGRKMRIWIALLAATIILGALLLYPHGPRHAFRHLLGLGPPAQSASH